MSASVSRHFPTLSALLVSAVLASGLPLGPARAGELVVVRSTVIGLEPGAVIDGTQMLTIGAGQKLSLISPAGKQIDLNGPFDGVPDPVKGATNDKLVTALATLISGHGRDSSQLGVIRDAKSGKARPPYAIDIGKAGPQCAVTGQAPTLWQRHGKAIESLSLTRLDTKESATIAWAPGASEQPWPARLKIADHTSYDMTETPAQGAPKRLDLQLIPNDLPSDAHRAAAMAERGCTDQAMSLLTGK